MEQNQVRTEVVTAGWHGHESNKEQPVNTAILAASCAALSIAEIAVADAQRLGENVHDEYGWSHGWACAISAARKAIRDLRDSLQPLADNQGATEVSSAPAATALNESDTAVPDPLRGHDAEPRLSTKDKNDHGALCATEGDAGPCSVPPPQLSHVEPIQCINCGHRMEYLVRARGLPPAEPVFRLVQNSIDGEWDIVTRNADDGTDEIYDAYTDESTARAECARLNETSDRAESAPALTGCVSLSSEAERAGESRAQRKDPSNELETR